MARTLTLISFITVILAALIWPADVRGQSKSYEILPAPDLWYNDVDGIRVGVRLLGQVPGTFEDGPHRLDAGFWVGTWFPDLPVSYYISYTEPIPAWSEYGSEASIQLISSIRTGYHIHGAAFNKRWQQGFDERRYREVRVLNTFEKRFDLEYAAFPRLWGTESKLLTHLNLELQDDNSLGWYSLSGSAAVQYLNELYPIASLAAIQNIPFNDYWGFRLRGFLGAAGSDADPEYLYSRSTQPSIESIESGITRAKGTIPQPWIESGNFHLAGGPNLRGYTGQDIESFTEAAGPALYKSFVSVNAEFDYPNPIGMLFRRIPYVSEFTSFGSYLFMDAGRSLESDNSTLFADAGAGFSLSLNIPDYLGKPRGFVLRYELPFWLSEPGMQDAFRLRHLFGFGAIFSF
ncbi:hypothetical protein [Rhodohalobacter mucosus]|uniref:Bacterial surface antigen (D15) domain-containing protein n=1 Tax=Rhodohalobacter mucosus TaxID=2079485 RepID=A0A316TWZ8_9BACT|nr:hypothetical protein [Rhodohalobacter mucosus]PWN07122.1 hypothetical protein DDZ15_07615 [Rhodohalobacter mucosus]